MIGDATYQKVVKTMHVIIFIRFCSMRKVLQRGTGGSLLSIFLDPEGICILRMID